MRNSPGTGTAWRLAPRSGTRTCIVVLMPFPALEHPDSCSIAAAAAILASCMRTEYLAPVGLPLFSEASFCTDSGRSRDGDAPNWQMHDVQKETSPKRRLEVGAL